MSDIPPLVSEIWTRVACASNAFLNVILLSLKYPPASYRMRKNTYSNSSFTADTKSVTTCSDCIRRTVDVGSALIEGAACDDAALCASLLLFVCMSICKWCTKVHEFVLNRKCKLPKKQLQMNEWKIGGKKIQEL